MPIAIDVNDPPIIRGIKTVGIGKKGSQDLDSELVAEIFRDIRENLVDPVSKAAFFAALVLKNVTTQEQILAHAFAPGIFENPIELAKQLTPDAPQFIQWICGQILSKHTLDRDTAKNVGDFLFSNQPGDTARGLIASALRVRYETADEYEGILTAIEETFEPPFKESVPDGKPIVQLAEPFDGVTRSYLITPLLADFIQRHNYRVVSLVGRSSGPKMGNNLLDIAKAINAQFARSNMDFGKPSPDLGWFLDQKDLSESMDRWVEIRKQTVKRPFLSTLEKFLNPVKAQILITSAFHLPYAEKMMTVAERAGYLSAIVMRNGQEGSLSFPLNRPVKALCSVVQCEGDYKREELEFNPTEILGFEIKTDEKLTNPSLEENSKLIKSYKEKGKSGNEIFDHRVKISCGGLKRAIDWIKCYMPV